MIFLDTEGDKEEEFPCRISCDAGVTLTFGDCLALALALLQFPNTAGTLKGLEFEPTAILAGPESGPTLSERFSSVSGYVSMFVNNVNGLSFKINTELLLIFYVF